MYYYIEQLAHEREREIARMAQAPLFTDGRGKPSWMWSKPLEGRRRDRSPWLGRLRSRRAKPEVGCSRAAAWAGSC
ncbi:MAG: hypothetical protein ACRDPJ_21200 [Nocardioidaceae bacterium]